MTNVLKIKEPKEPFRTKPDHEHVFKTVSHFRKYDIKVCEHRMETINPAKQREHAKNKNFKIARCGKKIFVLRVHVHMKKSLIRFERPDIIVPVHLTNGFASMEIILV